MVLFAPTSISPASRSSGRGAGLWDDHADDPAGTALLDSGGVRLEEGDLRSLGGGPQRQEGDRSEPGRGGRDEGREKAWRDAVMGTPGLAG